LNAIAVRPLEPEIIAPGEGIALFLAMHPLKLDGVALTAPAGLTIADLVAFGRDRVETTIVCDYSVWLEGHEIDRAYWSRVRPKPGTHMLVRAIALGGGDNAQLNSMLMLAVSIAAIALPVIIFPAGGIAAALLGAGITLGGSLLVNALFPIGAPKLDKDRDVSTAYAISGSSNEARPFGCIPQVLGKSRVYPKVAGQWYTEFEGDDQYLIGLLCFGYGPLDISDIKIGETPIGSFEDVETELRHGYADDAPITLYPRDVAQEDFSLELTEAAGWQSRTSAADADVLALDLTAPGGIVRVNTDGASKAYTVSIRAEYREAGSGGAWLLLGTVDLKGRSTKAQRRTLRKTVERGQYDVRFRKTSDDYDGDDHVTETVIATALRSYTNEAPVDYPAPLAMLGLRIRATGQLNGPIGTLNAICQSVVTSWSSVDDDWKPGQVSSGCADLFRHVLQGAANARPVADGGVDLDSLAAWAEFCAPRGFRFDQERDFQSSVYDTLKDIAAAGRATVLLRDGKWSVAWDDPESEIVQHFTPRNSWGFSGRRTYKTMPHALRIRFVNEQAGYKQDELIVYADGYSADGAGGTVQATLFESIELPGQTNPDNVWKHGRFHLAQAELRPEVYTLNADIEHIVCTRGDRVRVNHDVAMWGLGSGRVKSVDGLMLVLDEPVTMAADKAYSIRFRLQDGRSSLAEVVTAAGEHRTIEISSVAIPPEADDLFMFGEVDSESVVLRVLGIRPGSDNSAVLMLVDDAPEISMADHGDIPPFDSQISLPVDLSGYPPTNLVVRETLAGVDGETVTGAALSWATLAGQVPARFEVEVRDNDGEQAWVAAGSVAAPLHSIQLELAEGDWSFRVRSIFGDDRTSNWAEISVALSGLAGVVVPDVKSLRFSFDDKTATLTWDEVTLLGTWPVRYAIRKGPDWSTALDIGDVAQTRWKTYGNGSYWVAAYIEPAPGIIKYSADPEGIQIEGSVLVENVVATFDEADLDWPGAIIGAGEISGGNLVTTDADSLVYYEIPAGHVVDVGHVRQTQISTNYVATGVPVEQNMLDDPDFLANPDIFAAASARLIDCWVEINISDSPETDAFAPADIFGELDAFSAGGSASGWQKFTPGSYLGRFFKFRIALRSRDATVRGVVTAFSISVDVPDRLERITDYVLADSGETFEFVPEGAADPVPFKGGPDGAVVPNIVVTIQDFEAGDEIFVSDKTLSDVTIQIKNGGVGVVRTIDFIAQGW
jgi:hypothetical protein